MRNIFRRRPRSEREIAERNLKRSRIPALTPQPGYEDRDTGRWARYIVPHPSGHSYLDRWEAGRVIPAGITPEEWLRRERRREDEEEDRMMREDWQRMPGERTVVHDEDRTVRPGRARPEPEKARRRVR